MNTTPLVLTGLERVLLRVLAGTLRMMVAQLDQIPLEIRQHIGLPDSSVPAGWAGQVALAEAAAADAVEAPKVRPSIVDNSPAVPAP